MPLLTAGEGNGHRHLRTSQEPVALNTLAPGAVPTPLDNFRALSTFNLIGFASDGVTISGCAVVVAYVGCFPAA